MLKQADLALFSENIYTVKDESTIAGGVAVSGNTIIKVGSKLEIEPLIGAGTKVFDMGDSIIMPGFIDAHTHIEGPVNRKHRAGLFNLSSKEECASVIKEWADNHPNHEWVLGLGWNFADWENHDFPTKEILDAAVPNRPVYLQDSDYHNGWFNSKALELLGINKDTPVNEKGGIIHKYKSGEPTGFVQDGYVFDADALTVHRVIEENPEEYMRESINTHIEFGITAINEMYPRKHGDVLINYLGQLEQASELNLRVFFHYSSFENTIEELKKGREQYRSDKFRMNGAKIFLDGVWTTHSAALLSPYADMPEFIGKLSHTPEELLENILLIDKERFYIRVHCSGDRAARVTLDAYEAAIKQNPPWDRRHSIEHNDLIHPDDLRRYADLGVIANVTPCFITPTAKWKNNPVFYIYNESQLSEAWRFKSLIDSGAAVTYGADCLGGSINPFEQIYLGLTRIAQDGEPQGGFMPEEKVSVKEAIRCYTINGAFEIGMEDKLGTLESGKLADIIVLDRNFLVAPVKELLDTKVLLTVLDGQVVYERKRL